MKEYIKKNLEPLLIGINLAIWTIWIVNLIADTILKIQLIKH